MKLFKTSGIPIINIIKVKKRPKVKIDEHIYNHPYYKRWRTAVFKRDEFTCQYPGCEEKGYLEAHHIYMKSRFPEHVFEVWNGIALCKEHHEDVTGKEDKFIKLFLEINEAKGSKREKK